MTDWGRCPTPRLMSSSSASPSQAPPLMRTSNTNGTQRSEFKWCLFVHSKKTLTNVIWKWTPPSGTHLANSFQKTLLEISAPISFNWHYWRPSGVSSLPGRSHPPGWYKKWSPEWPWDTEEAQRAEPVACYPSAGCRPRPSDPGCPLHGVLGPQPGRHQGRVLRGREGLPQPAAHDEQETLHLAVEVTVGFCSWETQSVSMSGYTLYLMQNEVWAQSSIVSVKISNNYNSD